MLQLLQSLLLVGQQTGLRLQILQSLQLGLGQIEGRPLGRLLGWLARNCLLLFGYRLTSAPGLG